MNLRERTFISKIANVIQNTPSPDGIFAHLAESCSATRPWRHAWRDARQCHKAVASAFERMKMQARLHGDWQAFANVIWLSIPVWLYVMKGYAAALLRIIHLVDVLDLKPGQAAFDRFVSLSA